jgi:hypothetical protein
MTYSMVYGSNALLAISTKQTYQIATAKRMLIIFIIQLVTVSKLILNSTVTSTIKLMQDTFQSNS